MSSRYSGTAAALVLATGLVSSAAWLSTAEAAKESKEAAKASTANVTVARGRYLAQVAGCNDCHTAHYPQTGGQVPEKDWLKGDFIGWKGEWGTTYAPN